MEVLFGRDQRRCPNPRWGRTRASLGQLEITFSGESLDGICGIVIPGLIRCDPGEFMEKTSPNLTGINPFRKAKAGKEKGSQSRHKQRKGRQSPALQGWGWTKRFQEWAGKSRTDGPEVGGIPGVFQRGLIFPVRLPSVLLGTGFGVDLCIHVPKKKKKKKKKNEREEKRREEKRREEKRREENRREEKRREEKSLDRKKKKEKNEKNTAPETTPHLKPEQ
ncbi:hypothetical protein DUI87_17806 [Hirundo rustica rustica]|uniref:Uncharacterized protein n=1 Tax=Hirundo rustica rustica TaxID=333673 RepID=A0A3M0JUN9_HIRRU|nr:hypothetical protein DUI87_17806 [Hirundo rustica rustica]